MYSACTKTSFGVRCLQFPLALLAHNLFGEFTVADSIKYNIMCNTVCIYLFRLQLYAHRHTNMYKYCNGFEKILKNNSMQLT